MFKKLIKLSLGLCLFFSAAVFAHDAKMTPAKTPLTVYPKNPVFGLNLPSNPSTGFSWEAKPNKMIQVVSHHYVAPNTKLLGAPGYEIWVFKVLYPQKPFAVNQVTHQVMIYKRPWTTDGQTQKTFMIIAKKQPKETAENTVLNSPSQPIIAKASDSVFTLSLPTNFASTGYEWKIKSFDKKVLRLMGHKSVSSNSQLIGAPGYQVFMLQAKHSAFSKHKETKIVMEYARPWTKKDSRTQVFTVKLIDDLHSKKLKPQE